MRSVYWNGLALFGLIFLISCGDTDVFDPQQQLEEDIVAIDQFLDQNGIQAQEDPSGLRYVINEPGDGRIADLSDNVQIRVDFEGRLLSDGSVFSESDDARFFLPSLIAGWQIGIPLIEEGGSITLYIPSGLAFANNELPDIPANSNLIFDIELFSVQTQSEADAEIIDEFLADNGIQAQTGPSGLRFVINDIGSGESIQGPGSIVNVDFEGRLIPSNQIFDSAIGSVFPLDNLIQGWQIGLPLILEGGSITLYIPSELGFGVTGTPDGSIPGNANLVFDITLNSVTN